ncbi:hypothetical protein N1F89_04325, partial [Aquibium sp. A9E412]|uniref:hypothetical protein n=1 Tax=Aquibium sp. A9E412 TaxID=2976767 RepID=UPI0025B142CD
SLTPAARPLPNVMKMLCGRSARVRRRERFAPRLRPIRGGDGAAHGGRTLARGSPAYHCGENKSLE